MLYRKWRQPTIVGGDSPKAAPSCEEGSAQGSPPTQAMTPLKQLPIQASSPPKSATYIGRQPPPEQQPLIQTVVAPYCRWVAAPYCRWVVAPYCRWVVAPCCRLVAAPCCRQVVAPYCRQVVAPYCRWVAAPCCSQVVAPYCRFCSFPWLYIWQPLLKGITPPDGARPTPEGNSLVKAFVAQLYSCRVYRGAEPYW